MYLLVTHIFLHECGTIHYEFHIYCYSHCLPLKRFNGRSLIMAIIIVFWLNWNRLLKNSRFPTVQKHIIISYTFIWQYQFYAYMTFTSIKFLWSAVYRPENIVNKNRWSAVRIPAYKATRAMHPNPYPVSTEEFFFLHASFLHSETISVYVWLWVSIHAGRVMQ